MVKVGLVTGAVTPSARQAPRTKVVLPDPSSPATVTTSPTSSRAATRAAIASVSPAEALASERSTLKEAELDGIGLLLEGRSFGLRRRGARFADRSLEERRNAREVLLPHLQHRRRIERRSRVVDRIQAHGPRAQRDLLLLAVDAGYPRRAAREQLGREGPGRRDRPRLDELDLPEEVGVAGG